MSEPAAHEDGSSRSVDVPVLCVVAAVAWVPFLRFLYTNRYEAFDVGTVVVVACVVSVVAVAVAWFAGRRVDPTVVGAVVVAALFMIFSYGPFDRSIDGWLGFLCWAVVSVAVAAGAARLAARRRWARDFLLIFGGVAAAVTLVPLAIWELAGPSASEADISDDDVFIDEVAGEHSDVYLFILDAYARQDHLLEGLGYDNEPTVSALEDLGFVVVDDSRTAYPITPLAVSAMFEADYPVVEPAQLARGLDSFGPVMTGENRTVRTFTELGYEYWYSNPGKFEEMECEPGPNVRCLPINIAQLPGGEVGGLLSQLTPLAAVPAFDPPVDLPDPLDVVEIALDEPEGGPPRFVHAHIMSPHFPFRQHADCTPRDEPIDIDGARQGALGDAYVEQIECLNTRLVEAMERLVAADPEAIIAVVSDHGEWISEFFPGADAGPELLDERFANLSALRMPGCTDVDGVDELPALFPTIFSCLGGTEVEAPTPRRFYVDYEGTVAELDDDLVPLD